MSPPAQLGWRPSVRGTGTLLGNLGLRGLTSAARFVLMVAAARLISLGDLGTLGIVLSVVNVTGTALGLNFFQFATREMLSVDRSRWPAMLRDQAALQIVTYAVATPLLLGAFCLSTFSWRSAPWLLLIVLLDHASQEVQRVLVAASKPVRSNVVLFLRSGAWVYVCIAVMTMFPAARRIDTVWLGWIVGAGASLGYGAWSLRDLDWSSPRGVVDRAWLRRGLKSALVLLVGLVSLRSIFAVDRHFLESLVGIEAVGKYTFFAGIANTVLVLTDSGVLLTQYPKLIGSFQRGELVVYRATLRRMILGSLAIVVVLSLAIAATIPMVLGWTGKPELATGLPVLWVLLLGTAVQVAILLARNALYVRRLDVSISATCVLGLIVAVIANAVMIPRLGAMGAGWASLAGLTATFVSSCAVLAAAGRARPAAAPT